MPNERSSEGGHIKARVRSADSAVIKAVEHETAVSRKSVHRVENEKTKVERNTLRPATSRILLKNISAVQKRENSME